MCFSAEGTKATVRQENEAKNFPSSSASDDRLLGCFLFLFFFFKLAHGRETANSPSLMKRKSDARQCHV